MPKPLPPKYILLVDDDHTLAKTLATCIRNELPSVRLVCVDSAAKALQELENQPLPDLIVTDMYLKGRGGGHDVLQAALHLGVRAVAISGRTRMVPPGVEFVGKDVVVAELPRILRGDPPA